MVLLASWPTVTDDSGTKTDGTIINKALTDAVKASVEDQVHSSTNTLIKPKAITDEVVTARNGEASLSARLALIGGADQTITGGLNVGFTGTVDADTIKVGDDVARFSFSAGNPAITWDTGDFLQYARGTNLLTMYIGVVAEAVLSVNGLQIIDGLNVGFAAEPTADRICVGDAAFYLDINTASPLLNFDTNDGIRFTRASNVIDFLLGGSAIFAFGPTGVFSCGDSLLQLKLNAGAPQLIFGTNLHIDGERSTDILRLAAGVAIEFWPSLNTAAPRTLRVDPGFVTLGGYIVGAEITAPSAPATNGWIVYGVDNGAGKTQLMCLFATGAAQQLAIQP